MAVLFRDSPGAKQVSPCHGPLCSPPTAGTWPHIMTLCQGKWTCDLAPVSEGGWEKAGGTEASLSGARMTRRVRGGPVGAHSHGGQPESLFVPRPAQPFTARS